MTFAETLKRLREAKGWTQTRLSQESGVSQTYISDLEAGESVPTVPVALKLAFALDVPALDLMKPFIEEAHSNG